MKKPLFLSLIQIRFGNVACGAIVLQNLMTFNGPNHEDLVFLKRLDDRWNFLEVLVYQCLNLYRCKAPPAPGMLDGVFTRRSKTSVDSENYEVRRFVNIFTSPHTFILIASLCCVGRGGSTAFLTVRACWQYAYSTAALPLMKPALLYTVDTRAWTVRIGVKSPASALSILLIPLLWTPKEAGVYSYRI